MLKVKLKELEEKFFLADAQFEQTMAATRKVLTQRMLNLMVRRRRGRDAASRTPSRRRVRGAQGVARGHATPSVRAGI